MTTMFRFFAALTGGSLVGAMLLGILVALAAIFLTLFGVGVLIGL